MALTAGIERLSAARPIYVLAALGLYTISVFITGARWRGFLRALDGDISVVRAALATVGGIAAGNVTPSRVGTEPCRLALARRMGRASWSQAALAAGWDRLSEVPSVAVLGVVAAFTVREIDSAWRLPALSIALAAAMVAGAIGIHRLRRSQLTLAGWRERLRLDRVSLRVLAAGIGYSALVWIQDVLRLICAGLAIGIHLSPTQAAMLAVLTILAGLLPTIGGLVAVEGSLMAGLMAFGVELPSATAVVAVERLISFGFSTVAGGLVIGLVGGRSLWTLVFRAKGQPAAVQGAQMPTAHVTAHTENASPIPTTTSIK